MSNPIDGRNWRELRHYWAGVEWLAWAVWDSGGPGLRPMWRAEQVESGEVVDPDVWDVTASGESPNEWIGSGANEARLLDVIQSSLDDEDKW